MVFAARWKVRWTWGKGIVVGSLALVAALAFYWGRCATPSAVQAAAPEPAPATAAPAPAPVQAPAPLPAGTSDYASQPVAYIYGTIPITRAELGEYLIARYGADKLSELINHRIIEHVCQAKGIEVTAAEVDAALNEDLKGLNVNKLDFVRKVLKHYNKTLYEWKEDVIRPRLLLDKLCRARINITDEDLRDAFEEKYGERIQCRIIVWPQSEKNRVMNQYNELRDNEKEFDLAAKSQFTPRLAAAAGCIDPIGHHTLGDTDSSKEIERAVFALQPGQITPLLETPEGVVIFKCVKRIPPDASKRLADVQDQLREEIVERKMQAAIGIVFNEMRKEADPHALLTGYKTSRQIEEEVAEELKRSEMGHNKPKATPPVGN
jgi:hypothetical protein